jgi:hypothetical protein
MSNQNGNLPKVPPFVEPTPPNGHKQNGVFSMRGMLSITTLILSLGALSVSMLGGTKLVLDIFDEGLGTTLAEKGSTLVAETIVLAIAFLVGWIFALVCIRIFNNLILPIVIQIYAWVSLAGVCGLYVRIILKLYGQAYDATHYWAYLIIMSGGIAVLVFLHLLVENHDLRPFAIPLMLINAIQLIAIVYRYVFTTDPQPAYLGKDLFFFIAVTTVAVLMLAHIGVLAPLRNRINGFFDRSGKVIRPEA